MTHVHYKFSSKLSYDTVVFDGPHITLRDLKRQIMDREKLRAGDCDLQITNAQTKQEYTDDEGLIPKGSSVIVRRIPISGGKSSSNSKTHNIERSDAQLHHAFGALKAMDDQTTSSALPFFTKMVNLADADVSEEDKIKVVLNQSAYDSMNYNKKFGTVLPANYTCYRCGNTGHHIRNCPTSGQDKNFEAPLRIKKSTGIPRSFMVEVDDPNIKGAMLTNCGRYAIPAIDAEAYAIGKKEKPPFVPQEQPKTEADEDPVPDELVCLICRDLLSDAVVIPCCGNSYCDDCIRTTLLDSEEHVCPTCSQSNVSPDTLIANKFLRQAVNNFKKERDYTKSLTGRCSTSQSQNPTLTPSPAPTPPPLTVQSQPQKPHQSTSSQLDSLVHRPQAADAPPLSGNPPSATGLASACNTPNTSLQPEQSCLELPDKKAEEETHDDSAAAAAPSVLVSDKESTAAPLQLIPVVNNTTVAVQPQTRVSVNQQQSSFGPALRHSGPSTFWGSSSSSPGCPPGGWTQSQQLNSSSSSSSSSYTATAPPLFPSPLFQTYLSAHQSHSSYPPGYPPTTPMWKLPCPQGAPIPSLCSPASTSSIPALIPKEWDRHQRKKKGRSPHGGSTYRRSSSRSNSKSSKSKSSRSYSRSSSRSQSRSRSRSQGRSRRHSPYSRHRDHHTRSHASQSYSYGYKRSRSPTPSSSSSPRVGYHSRSKSPSDHRKNRHHSGHHTKKSASSSYSSRRQGEPTEREVGGSGASLASSLYGHDASSLELDRERYLQWKKEYKEWYEKYFSSYVSHFHQMHIPLINLPPPPQWEGSKTQSHANSDSFYRCTARMDGRSPPSQSSSDSRSPPSQSSSDSRSTPSQSSSDTRSSPSHTSNDSRSPPSQSSSDGHSTPSEDGAHPGAYQQQRDRHLPKSSKEMELQERSKDDQQVGVPDLEDLSTLKYDQRTMKEHEEGRQEESSSPDAADSRNDSRKDERRHDTGPHTGMDDTSMRDKATTLKPQSLDKDCERKSREQRHLEGENGWRKSKDSDSRQDVERRHKIKPNKEADRVDSDRYRNPGGSKAPDLRSDKNRKRKGENPERNETCKRESSNPFDRKKQNTENKKEKKTWTLTEGDIWEGGITVKPQKKISININLDGKMKEEKTEKQGSITGKSKEEIKKTGDGEEKSNRGETDIKEKKESSREKEGMFEEKINPDKGEARPTWERATFRDDKREMWEKIGVEENTAENIEGREEEDFDLWHCALRGVNEEKKSKKQWEEGYSMKTSKEEEVTRDKRRSMTRKVEEEGEDERARKGSQPGESKPKEALMEGGKRRMVMEEEDTWRFKQVQSNRDKSHHNRPNSNMDDGSSSEDCQERTTMVKTLEDFAPDRATEREDQLVLKQVPRSKWEKEESEEEEQSKGEIRVQKPPPVVLSSSLMTPANRETDGDNGQKRQRSVDKERDRDRARQRERDREKERDVTLPSLDRSVAPSSGKDRTDSTWCMDRQGERRMEKERWRDKERGRERARSRDRQKESRRSKEKTKEEERGRERGHSSIASGQKKNLPSSGHFSSHSTSQEVERRDRQRGGHQDHEKSSSSLCPGGKHSGSRSKERSSTCRAAELPDKHAHETYRDMLLDPKRRDRNHPHDYHNHRDPSGNHRHQDRPAGTHRSSPSLPHSQGKERDPFPSRSSSPKPSKSRRSSPSQELMQNRSRNESKEETGEWKRNKLMKESKGERERGSEWRDEADKLAGETKWEGGREGEERPSSRCSSVSSSASQENSKDDRREERKRKRKKEKSHAAPELLEEEEVKKYKHKKKSKSNKDEREEESGGEVDDRWKEEEDHTKFCSSMLS